MTITIQLDGSALDRLFPEGSEARLDLKKTVVSNFIDKVSHDQIAWKLQGAEKTIQDLVTKHVNEILARDGLSIGRLWGGTTLTEEFKKNIAKQVTASIQGCITTAIEEQKPAVQRNIAASVNDLIKSGSTSAVRSMVRELVKEQLALAFQGK